MSLSFSLSGLIFIILTFVRTRRECKIAEKCFSLTLQSYVHDIGNALTWAGILIRSFKGSASIKEIEELVLGAEKAFHYSIILRKEALSLGRDTLNFTILDIKRIYSECKELLLIDNPKLKIKENFGHTEWIRADEVKLRRVFMNLLQNAFNCAETFVCISSFNKNKVLYIEIINDGDPIPDTLKKDIFEPFISKSGVGLGLYICKYFVDLHGGDIAISSDNGVTKVQFCLPSHGLKISNEILTKSIAFIDDEVFFLSRIKQLFEKAGFKVSIFKNTDSFFYALIEEANFDWIIVDRFGRDFDSVRDEFPRIAREEFGFQGKIILYTNSLLEIPLSGFDACISKQEDLTPELLMRL